jgi:hypothetical protein
VPVEGVVAVEVLEVPEGVAEVVVVGVVVVL